MKRFFILSLVAVLLSGLATSAVAQNESPIAKGKVLFSLQATELTAIAVDTLFSGDADFPELFSASLVGGKATIAYGLSDKWTLNGGFLWATGFNKQEPPDTVGLKTKQSVTALGVRVGLDRHVQLANWFSFYGGPGLQWTSASSKIVADTAVNKSVTFKNPSTSTLSLSGRMGAFIRLSEKFGLYGDLGHQLSYTTKKVRGKASTLSSSHDGNMGVAFMF